METDACGGNHSHPTLVGDSGSQAGKGDADTHSPLNDGNSGNEIFDCQFRNSQDSSSEL